MNRSLLLRAAMALNVAAFTACRKPDAPAEPQTETQPEPVLQASPPALAPTRVDIDVPMDDPHRWLFVEKVAGDAKGGWATGSFDAQRNKISIQTRDVEAFAIDVGMVPINWQKLVVISIDGKNGELRKRDYHLLHFVRAAHGEWQVHEP